MSWSKKESMEIMTKKFNAGNFSANDQYYDGFTMVHAMCRAKTTPLVRIEKCLRRSSEKPNLNLQTTSQRITALHCACHNNRKDIIQLLLKEGADPSVADSRGIAPVVLTLRDYECFVVIVQARPELVNYVGTGPQKASLLQEACHFKDGSLEIVRFLCNNSSLPIDYKTATSGRTALSFCIEKGLQEMALELLLHGAQLPLALQGLNGALPTWIVTMALQVKDCRIGELQEQVESERKKRRVVQDD